MLKKKHNSKRVGGFTIVELLIASAVFSTVLLVALTGFLQIGRVFYKGVSNTQTQDAARQVINDLADNLKTASSTDQVGAPTTTPSGAYRYLCVGSYRYTWGFYKNTAAAAPNRPIFFNANTGPNYDPGSTNASFGLLKNVVPGEGTCPAPCVQNGGPSSVATCSNSANCAPIGCQPLDTSSPTEMLGNGMRIGDISITSASAQDLYNLGVTIAFGDDEVLDYDAGGQPFCTGNTTDQKFCAVDQLSTTVFRGELHP